MILTDCQEIKKIIDDTLYEVPQADIALLIQEHISECGSCKKYYLEVVKAKEALSQYQSSKFSIPDQFISSLQSRLKKSEKELSPLFSFSDFLKWPILTAVSFALILIVLGAGLYLRKAENQNAILISSTELDAGEPVTIKLQYEASRNIKNAKISLTLDNEIFFYSSNPKIRRLKKKVWEGDLKKGTTTIPFVVGVNKLGKFEINSRADYDGFSHPHKIVLTSTEKKVVVTYFSFAPEKIDDKS